MHEIYLITRVSIFIIFFYHGLVPKILFGSEQEILMNDTLIPMLSEQLALQLSGWAEIAFSAVVLIFFNSKWPMYPVLLFSSGVTIALILTLPALFTDAFNPFTINLSLFVLAFINLKSHQAKRLAQAEIK